MTLPLFRTRAIIPPKNPRLPAAPVEYDQRYIDATLSILRQYFNTIDNFAQPFTDNYGGAYLQFPNGAFHQDGNSTLTASMTNSSTAAIQVATTSGFLSSGALLIGTELIQYTGITSTTFTGITRGAYGSSTSTHAIGDSVTEAQPVPNATTSLAVAMTTTDTSNQVYIGSPNSRIYFSVSGYYNIAFSVQFLQFTTSADNITLWLRQNGTDVPFSAGIATVPSKHGTIGGTALVSWNQVLGITAGDYVELIFASDSGNTVAATYPAGTAPVHPVSPSVALTATFVSALFPPV